MIVFLFSYLLSDAHLVRWSPDGDRYVVVVNDKMDIYKLETASVTGTITNPKRISSIKFLNVSSQTKADRFYQSSVANNNEETL